MEAVNHAEAAFITLTYDEENQPNDKSLVPRDLQLWLKRVRTGLRAFRFYAVGEYGAQTWRPHYHAVLFGVGRRDGDFIQSSWGKGFTYTGDFSWDAACYVAQYTTKKMTSKDDERLQGRHPEFARMSLRPGIGALAMPSVGAALDHFGRPFKDDVPDQVRVAGRVGPIGRYLRVRLREELGHEFKGEGPERAREEYKKLLALYESYVARQGVLSLREFADERDAQRVRNMEARLGRKRGGEL